MATNDFHKLKSNLPFDLSASIVVFLVALPLCLGIALASGAPLFSGIVSGAIGAIVVGALSSSPLSVSGPAAGLTSIVFAAIHDVNSFPVFLSCVVVAGIFQVLLGVFKAGVIGHFVPLSVIRGMLAAIGLILILKQVPHAVGYDVDFEGDENFYQSDGENTFSDITQALSYFSGGAVIIAIISLVVLIFWDGKAIKRHPYLKVVPGPLIVVIVGVLLNSLFVNFFPALELKAAHMVSFSGLSGEINIMDLFTFPDFSRLADPMILRIAISLALVASLETLLSIEAADKLDPHHRITPLNQELKAQGIGNMVAGLMGGLPVTSVIVRTSANVAAGARSKLSTIFHGILLITSVILFPTILEKIPLACLAAILIVIGYKLASVTILRDMIKRGYVQLIPFLTTIIAILFSDLLTGVFIGLLVAVFFVIKSNFKSAILVIDDGGKYLLKFTKDVSFLNKAAFRLAIETIPRGSTVIVDGSHAQFIDQDIIALLEDFIKSAPIKNISVELVKSNGAKNAYFRP
ncbi:MAG: SulP family inorganic anion transporter [Cyclobacteriaceae bacterium]|nr:SulP family inorganic anion transporter [Cyclobacteriaceae bacterium]